MMEGSKKSISSNIKEKIQTVQIDTESEEELEL